MQIKEAKIYNFGKLQNRTFEFGPGINLIYGENEAGKTTLHMFLKSMLFGLEKQRGRAGVKDEYLKYEPWHAPSYYSGALRFEVADRPFFLERNFYSKEKKDFLSNEADGEELSVAYGDLEMLLGGISRETYENTYDIPQCGVVTEGKMSQILSEYLSDAAGSGNASTKVTRAIRALEQKRKERQAELKKYNAQKEERKSKLCLQKEILEKELREQQELLAQTRQAVNRQTDVLLQKQSTDKRLEESWEKSKIHGNEEFEENKIGAKRIGLVALLLLIINAISYLFWYQNKLVFCCSEVLFLVLGVWGVSLVRRQKRRKQEQVIEEAEETMYREQYQMVREKQEQLEQLRNRLEDNVQEKEVYLANLEEELFQICQMSLEEKELVEDIEALEMAAVQIKNLAAELCEDIKDELDAEISKQVSHITDGKYDRIRIDENGNLEVFEEGRKINLEQLSRGTYEQLYLALRLAVGAVVTKEEPLPVMLDEIFAMYDDRRLEQTLRMLSKMGRQIFLFTCQQREEEQLRRMGITYNKVCL